MPLYDYQCAKCGHVVEVRHGFDDLYAEPCPTCGGELSRVFNPAPIVFKGSGFYVTDSRTKSSAKESGSKESTSKESGSDSKPKSSGSGESAA